MVYIPEVGSFLYGLVKTTWFTAAVLTKYLLLVNLGALAYRGELSFRSFGDQVLEWGKPYLLGVAALGTVLFIGGVTPKPFMLFLSEILTVSTLGFLFWKY
ncbi:MAG: hypothetical protein ABEJ36_05980 [Candidatus Nanosalina sp.]